jgi:predicted adenine nucleotide alpha hydrolase (AANH) superfamily ATPase
LKPLKRVKLYAKITTILKTKPMKEIKQINSEINVLEARNRQLKYLKEDYGQNTDKDMEVNQHEIYKLNELKIKLIKELDVTEPQYGI